MTKIVRDHALFLSRRQFIVASTAAAGGGLALGFHLPAGIATAVAQSAGGSEVNAWVVINPNDSCVIRIARSEMGQGTLTGLAQLVAEELECDWKKVTVERITPGAASCSNRSEHAPNRREFTCFSTGRRWSMSALARTRRHVRLAAPRAGRDRFAHFFRR